MVASRRGSRRNGSCGKRRCWTRRQSGGTADVNDRSMDGPSALSLAQGGDYQSIHRGQHGGAAVSLAAAAPVGYTGVLDDGLRAYARVNTLDSANAAIQGMSDQGGGGRRRRGRKGRRGTAGKGRRGAVGKGRRGAVGKGRRMSFGKARKAMTRRLRKIKARLAKLMRKMTMRRRRGAVGKGRRGGHRGGGGYQSTNQADYGAPGMLLSAGQERQALMGMNPEWKLAADPQSFAPRMSS